MKDCKIVQDLLPNYIEGLTSEDTNKFIENHLNDCASCKKMLENMQNDFNEQHKKVEASEINYAKKLNKEVISMRFLFKIIVLILTVSLFIFIVSTASKFLILQSLSAKEAMIQNANNYYVKKEFFKVEAQNSSNSGVISNQYSVENNYYKDGAYLKNITSYFLDNDFDTRTMTLYKKDGENLICFDNETYLKPDEMPLPLDFLPSNTIWENLYLALFCNINKVGEYYVISSNYTQSYYSEKTGLKNISYMGDSMIVISYEFGNVTDDDVARPDLTGFRENPSSTGTTNLN